MIVTSVEYFVDNALDYINLASNGEEIEIIVKKDNGFKSLQLKLKDNDEE